jgi:hypothetical protein
MSEAVRVRPGWGCRPTSSEVVGAMTNTAAAAEIAVRAAVGAAAVTAVIRLVRNHPLLSVLLAAGIGCALGNEWRHRNRRTAGGTSDSGRV